MERWFKSLFVLVVFFVFTASAADKLPNIVILATGGTIAGSAATGTQTTGYKAGALGVDTLINAVPEVKKLANVKGEQFSNMASENMTGDVVLKLSQRVNELLARDDVDGVVITHGTDTVEESAYFLHLTVKSDKPVVFVAAMRPATAISADGPMNLLEAVRVAGDKQSRGRGVMVVINDRIGSARYITKTNASTLDTFKANEEGYLGVIIGNRIYYQNRIDKVHTTRSVFDVRGLTSLPKVDILYGYQDDPEYLYDAAIQHGVKGIVYAGMGAGSVSVRGIAGMRKAMEKGVVVIRSTRTGNGIVPPDEELPGLVSDSLNPAHARILLMLALTRTSDPKVIQEYFHTY
ncbi:asparaginase [Dickeya oryzae]|uniref:Asparaginase n=1 Tax=Dickeya oryzae TaxID=1240404 RepID=A0ABS5BBA3_9GAMM|nr:asparaginase [Dickeya oryzae]MBP2849258.1 asparaginase [Dickeya oryzae]MBP2857729.1 asparaginase [Dickeya oryzae]UUE10947.1 asparaginase [Dickeya zeae]